jgi:hypothetical protein
MRKAPVLPTPGLHFTDHRYRGNDSMSDADFTLLTHERLKELLSYDIDSGTFTWKKSIAPNIKIGSVAGSIDAHGYTVIGVDKKHYKAHRLAWLFVTGEFPKKFIDHINGNRADNRIKNLREATKSENAQNQRSPIGKTASGALGVTKHKEKFRARIQIDGHLKHLGLFDTVSDAYAAYIAAKRKLHPACTI